MLHYHVICEGNFHYPEIVSGYDDASAEQFTKLVQLIYDVVGFNINGERYSPSRVHGVEGSPLVLWTPYKAIFTNGIVVKRHICRKDCIEKLEYEERTGILQMFRDVIYEH